MSDDRRPLGLPEFSALTTDRPQAADRRPLAPVDRTLFLPPPNTDQPDPTPARRPLADGGLTFSGGA
ncbi:hypothetical protein [Kitasatospora sp. NPDC085879]|uniref:hypothetical protein n=1 Tax=Kitasatospora sp. NPDC085879 TaxID=3154769 RepID=UPI000BB131EC|nr:hypothetical protein [Streptomyces sp. TLI_235]PBC69822.1 hypothetical protein BX265_7180 [Streptomyces sp. TLI_235]